MQNRVEKCRIEAVQKVGKNLLKFNLLKLANPIFRQSKDLVMKHRTYPNFWHRGVVIGSMQDPICNDFLHCVAASKRSPGNVLITFCSWRLYKLGSGVHFPFSDNILVLNHFSFSCSDPKLWCSRFYSCWKLWCEQCWS